MNKKINQTIYKPVVIYIAEQNQAFAQIMVNKLRGLHIGNIKHYENGESMLAELKKNSPTLVIVNYSLNEKNPSLLDGKGILAVMKKDFQAIPVIIITSVDTLNKAEEIIESGATDYIIKNDDWFDNLQSTIFNLIEIRDLKTDLVNINSRLKKRIIWILAFGLLLSAGILAYVWLT